MADDLQIDEIHDEHGNVRRLGSLPSPEGLVSAFPTFASAMMPWSAADILRAISDPTRVPSRVLFGKAWIQNQRDHGSCNGYAGAGALARAMFMRANNRTRLLLSGAYLYSKMNHGKDQGSILEDGLKAVQKWGVCSEALVPWDKIYPKQQAKTADAEAAKQKGFLCYVADSLEAFRTGIAAGYFGIVAVHAGSRYQKLDKNGIAGVDNGPGNHAVCIDDLVVIGGKLVYNQPGSWDVTYGDDGSAYLTDDHFGQTCGKHKFYLLTTTSEASL